MRKLLLGLALGATACATTGGSDANGPVNGSSDLRAFRKNYILATVNDEVDESRDGIDREELLFQASLQYPLLSSESGALRFAYTAQSFWQVFDTDRSAPIRTTDHEPELFWEWAPMGAGRTWNSHTYRLGITHESNGESGFQSRTWNRVVGELLLFSAPDGTWYVDGQDGWRFSTRVWAVFDHEEPVGPERGDFRDHMGRASFALDRYWGSRSLSPHLTVEVRSNFDFGGENRSSLKIDLGTLVYGRSRILLHYFLGYGENLLDYDLKSNRFGIGFQMSP